MGGASGHTGYVENVEHVENAALRTAIGRYYDQRPDPELLRAEVREATLLVPVRHGREVYTAAHGGVRWIMAFTSREAFARFAVTRPELRAPYWFITVTGARLLDSFTWAIASATNQAINRVVGTAVTGGGVGAVGMAVDIGGEQPMLLPAPTDTPSASLAASGLDAAGLDAAGLDAAGVGGG